MEIREAQQNDIGRIVDLLKLSLGESLMPKSEEYWRWKHVDNPFGQSPVLLYEENGNLLGVRAFMRWRWLQGEQRYEAVRAVDTATHPAHQGKGIFKKLTLALVENCLKDRVSFVFNTPNKQSGPGYLKMGWKEAGKLPVTVSVARPFSMIRKIVAGGETKLEEIDRQPLNYYLTHSDLPSLIARHRTANTDIVTDVGRRYLAWRYAEVPMIKYFAVGVESANELRAIAFARSKETKMGREMRVTDVLYDGLDVLPKLRSQLKDLAQRLQADYITIGGLQGSGHGIFNNILRTTRTGPMVTVRSLTLSNLDSLMEFNHWRPSLGDLELF